MFVSGERADNDNEAPRHTRPLSSSSSSLSIVRMYRLLDIFELFIKNEEVNINFIGEKNGINLIFVPVNINLISLKKISFEIHIKSKRLGEILFNL